MFTRNLTSIDAEEAIRGNPIDGVVLLVGCDKTTPALPMGAASCDVPAIAVSGGPMLNGKHLGQDIGSGTVVWKLHEQVKAGSISLHEFLSAEAGMSGSAGTCNTMGTASTMACMAEALGVTLPHNAAIPAVDSRRHVLAHMSGQRIVEMVHDDLRLSRILTRAAFENAMLVLKNCGPRGYPGMAEVGNMGLPPKRLAQGVTDRVRISDARMSDARMSGTAYGTGVLQVSPEARAGGPLAVVQEGDWIALDCHAGILHLAVSDTELAARRAAWADQKRGVPADASGYRKLYVEHVLQADEGCDFDFLVGCRGAEVPRHSH